MPAPSQAMLDAEAEFPLSDSVALMPRDVVLNRLLDYFFARKKGCYQPIPKLVAQRAFAIAIYLQRDELTGGMTMREVAAAFGETPAATYARIEQVNALLAKSGAKATHTRFQRTETQRANMSAAQRGNHNRTSRHKRVEV